MPAQTDGRDESPEERLDRLFGDLLQELRVMQTGAQLTAGFLLTLPFQQRFTTLSGAGRALYLALVSLALLTTALIMAAVAVHRQLSGRHVKQKVVAATARLIDGVLFTLSLMIVGISVLLFDMVVGGTVAVLAGVVAGLVLAGLLLALPRVLLSETRENE